MLGTEGESGSTERSPDLAGMTPAATDKVSVRPTATRCKGESPAIRGARGIETYQFDHEILDDRRPLGVVSKRGRTLFDYERALDSIGDARAHLGRADQSD